MVDFFTNKSGIDTLNGLQRTVGVFPAGPKLTVQGMELAMSPGDRGLIGAGFYNEAVTVSKTGLTFEADLDDAYGPVVMDGGGALASGFTNSVSATIKLIGLIIENYTAGGVQALANAFTIAAGSRDCVIRNCGNGISFGAASGNRMNIQSTTRKFNIHSCDRGINYPFGGPQLLIDIEEFTIADCTSIGVLHNPTVSGGVNRMRNSIVKDCPTLLSIRNPTQSWLTTHDNNVLEFAGGAKTVIALVDQLTLAAHKLAMNGGGAGPKDDNSRDEDPIFADAANGMYRLDPSSPSLVGLKGTLAVDHAGFSSRATFGVSNNRNSSLWTAAVINDMTLVGDNYELTTPPDGDVAHDVINFGKTRNVRRVVVHGVQNYPTEVLDQDETDIEPNRPQVEYRISDTVFLKGAGAPAFVVFVNGQDLNVSGKFFQTRITGRNNGVAS